MKIRIITAAAIATLATVACATMASAQAPGSSASMPASNVSHADRRFAETAGEAGMAEVEMAKVAQQRAADTEVRNFAERMVTDHGKANQQLTSIAGTKGIPLPGKLSGKDSRELAKLQKLEGAKFDREYVHVQLGAHKDAVKLFKKESSAGKDSDLREFAGSTLPTLQEHLTMVSELSKNIH